MVLRPASILENACSDAGSEGPGNRSGVITVGSANP